MVFVSLADNRCATIFSGPSPQLLGIKSSVDFLLLATRFDLIEVTVTVRLEKSDWATRIAPDKEREVIEH